MKNAENRISCEIESQDGLMYKGRLRASFTKSTFELKLAGPIDRLLSRPKPANLLETRQIFRLKVNEKAEFSDADFVDHLPMVITAVVEREVQQLRAGLANLIAPQADKHEEETNGN